MKQSTLILSMLLLTFIGRCQSGFERLYDAGAAYSFSINELESGNLVLAIGWSHGASFADQVGNISLTQSYWPNPMVRMAGLAKATDSLFYFSTGYLMNDCGVPGVSGYQVALGKVDSVGQVLDYQSYTLNAGCRNLPGDLTVLEDGGAITWGSDTNFFAVRVDSNLGLVWAKQFIHHGGFQFIKELPSGDLLAGINMDSAGAVLARLDAMGNAVWVKSYNRPRGMLHDAVIESDSSFVITGFTDSIGSTNSFEPLPSFFHPKLFLMKLNGTGDVQWSKGFNSDQATWYTRQPTKIERTVDGKYVVLATLGQPGYNAAHAPFLMKLDENADTIWSQSLGASEFSYCTKDLHIAMDGGIIHSGMIYGNLPNSNSNLVYLYKADSTGRISCMESEHIVQVSSIFPVDSLIDLLSISGAEVEIGLVNDTILSPIISFDACTITQIPTYIIKPQRPQIRPNPTTGRFTVEFPDPLQASSYYSVYDSMGRLLYLRPLPTGATLEDVDLSRFGRGTYTIRFTSPDRVQHERVVLE